MSSLAERLYYENVIRELGDSSEIIYLSVANAALAHLPYLIALDHQSRRVPSHLKPHYADQSPAMVRWSPARRISSLHL